MNQRWVGLASATCLFACGRSTTLQQGQHDANAEADVAEAPADAAVVDVVEPPPDGGVALRDAPPDPDSSGTPPIDANLSDATAGDLTGLDQPVPPLSACAALKPLADKGVLTVRRSERVVFAPDSSWIVLKTPVGVSPGVAEPAKLVRIGLPAGDETVLSDSGGTAEALGPSGAILLTGMGPGGADLAVYDETGMRTLATGICDHASTKDGSRIYVIRDCTASGIGALDVIDVKTAKVGPVATSAVAGSLAVSPSGDWAAFIVERAHATDTRIVNLVNARGESYTISVFGTTYLHFISDDRLLFTTDGRAYITLAHIRSELWVHEVGAAVQTTRLSTNTEIGLFGFQVSADRNWVLLAQSQQIDGGPIRPALLFARRLDAATTETITSNLISYWDYQLPINAFAFAAVGDRAVYATYDDGLWSYSMLQATSRRLSADGMFVMSPTRAEVAIREVNHEAGTSSSLRLVALDSGADVVSFASDGTLGNLQFLPDGRGLLFTETHQSESGASSSLRFISSAHPESVVLAQWNTTLLSSSSPGPQTYATGSYPVDPTGCFTIADVDGAPRPGTRLILLPE